VEVMEWVGVGRNYADYSSASGGWSNASISARMFVRSMSQLLFPSKETLTSLPLFTDCNKT